MARCSVCGKPAVAYIPYARRYLCGEHLVEFVERKVERAIRDFKLIRPGDLVVAAVSGGKDSATLAGVLERLRGRLGFRLVLAHIDLGIPHYSERSREAVEKLSQATGVETVYMSVRELVGDSVPRLAFRARRPVCSVCGMVKRYLLNALAVELGADRVATGHNADDIAAYALKAFLNMDFETLARQVPVSETVPGLAVSRIKPLFTLYEKESFLYSIVRGLPFYHEECPHARLTSLDFRLKEEINRLEEGFPGLKLQLVRGLARKARLLPRQEWEPSRCPSCGLISGGGECSFCRLTRRLYGEPRGARVREALRGIALTYKGARGNSGGSG